MNKVILHCDMNNFFASVECMLNPAIKDKPVAVCGSVEDRHGIVLAKNYEAKKYNVQTAEPVWQAQKKCPDLIIVPPRMDEYIKYSKLAREIYCDYTDMVEPFGLDECWLDVTGSSLLFGSGEEIAYKIKERIKEELGLTISVGVSYNKTFAKLGSDMKKPDAVTVITEENFKEKLWSLPVDILIGVGKSTKAKLDKYMIESVGDLAKFPVDVLVRTMGKSGTLLWKCANGMDDTPVARCDFKRDPETVGRGITLPKDLINDEEVWKVIYGLSQDISRRLRKHNITAGGVHIGIKNNKLSTTGWQIKLTDSTTNGLIIAKTAFSLYRANYNWAYDIRAITVTGIYIEKAEAAHQLSLISDYEKVHKIENMDKTIDNINSKYGHDCVFPALYVNQVHGA